MTCPGSSVEISTSRTISITGGRCRSGKIRSLTSFKACLSSLAVTPHPRRTPGGGFSLRESSKRIQKRRSEFSIDKPLTASAVIPSSVPHQVRSGWPGLGADYGCRVRHHVPGQYSAIHFAQPASEERWWVQSSSQCRYSGSVLLEPQNQRPKSAALRAPSTIGFARSPEARDLPT
jgi:hypothetical protein